jgi:hypothetical protein
MKVFEPFRLDTVNYCLWRAETRMPLTPKGGIGLPSCPQMPEVEVDDFQNFSLEDILPSVKQIWVEYLLRHPGRMKCCGGDANNASKI